MISELFQVEWTTFFSFGLVAALHQVFQSDAVIGAIEWRPTCSLLFHSSPIDQLRIATSFSRKCGDEHDRVAAKIHIDELSEWW
jgi:hypothetical protein